MTHEQLNSTNFQSNKKRPYFIFLNAIFLTFMLSAFFNHDGFGQANGSSYKTAIGVKFYPTGVTLKTFVRSNAAFEAIGYFWDRGTRITALYEYHHNLSENGSLKWYIGPGAHVGFYKPAFYNGGTSVGIDGVLGLDYKFPGIPINVSLDWQPSYEFGNYEGFSGNWGGVGLRLAL